MLVASAAAAGVWGLGAVGAVEGEGRTWCQVPSVALVLVERLMDHLAKDDGARRKMMVHGARDQRARRSSSNNGSNWVLIRPFRAS